MVAKLSCRIISSDRAVEFCSEIFSPSPLPTTPLTIAVTSPLVPVGLREQRGEGRVEKEIVPGIAADAGSSKGLEAPAARGPPSRLIETNDLVLYSVDI